MCTLAQARGLGHVLLAAALGLSAQAQDFTLHIDGGMTNSSRHVALPAWPPGTTGARLRIDHDMLIRFGEETDGSGGAVWACDAWISAGWSLRSGGHRLASARVSQFVQMQGPCVPFDGLYDYSGASGSSVSFLRETHREVTVSLAEIGAGLWLDTGARSAWDMTIAAPWNEFGSLYWLNQCEWSADVEGDWIP